MQSNKSLIIIPCGGKSSRFGVDGKPKSAAQMQLPGKPKARMLDYVAQFRKIGIDAIAIVRREHHKALPDAVTIDDTRGQSETVAKFLIQYGEIIPADCPIIVVNSDNYFHFNLDVFSNQCALYAAGALVFRVQKDYGYGYVDGFPIFEEAVEKEMVTPYALAGAFYFRSKYTFLAAYNIQTIKEQTVNGEYYISTLFQNIEEQKLAVQITENDFEHWTAPHDITRLGGEIFT